DQHAYAERGLAVFDEDLEAQNRRLLIIDALRQHPDLKHFPSRAPFHRLQHLIILGASRAGILTEILHLAWRTGLLAVPCEQRLRQPADSSSNGHLLHFLV